MLSQNAIKYLTDQGLTENDANESQISKAKAYSTCYDWYINTQKVLPENAALASKVWVQKYALLNESGICLESTPEDMWHRVAKALAIVETQTNRVSTKTESEWKDEFFDALKNWKYSPGGSGLAAIGNSFSNMSASNCMVLKSPEDSLEDIFRTCNDMAQAQKYRAGTGLCIGKLRPYGAPVNNCAKISSGSVSFMDLFSKVTATVGLQGRTGATMITCPISHPDIERFIEEKQDLDKKWFFDELSLSGIDINDWKYSTIQTRLKSTTKANISIKISDEFMNAVESDSDFMLSFDNISRNVKATSLWNKIVASNVNSAEPGLLFWDTITRNSVAGCYGDVVAEISGEKVSYSFKETCTNPCQPDYVLFLTKHSGLLPMRDINVGDIVWTGKSWSKLTKKWFTGNKEVFRYHLSNNTALDMTENHRVVSKGRKVEIKDAESVDRQQYEKLTFSGNTDTLALLAGMVLGDGSKQKNGGTCAYLNIGINDIEMELAAKPYTEYIIPASNNKCKLAKLKYDFSDLHLDYNPVWDRSVSSYWLSADSQTMATFLRGLYTANGSVLANGTRVALKTTSKVLAGQVVAMLESLGIRSYITINKPSAVQHNNGLYTSKQSYDVNTTDVATFCALIGFEQQYKMDKAYIKKPVGNPKPVRVVSRESLGFMDVFDYTVEADEHTIMQNGLLVSNCSELALSEEEICSLGSLCLYSFVDNKFKPNAYTDINLLERVTRLAVRMQDNIREYDMDRMPLKGNKTPAILGRRIGIGIYGLADYLASLGFKYDSDEAIEHTKYILNQMKNWIYDESVTLGQEKGVFPIWCWETEKDNPYLNSLSHSVLDRIKTFGRRNIACQTIPPTGSLSIISNSCSSGIEPVFKKSYYRAVKKVGSEDTVRYVVNHQALQDCLEAGGDPSVFVEASSVDWNKRIQMQAVCQSNIDHSISSTINLPEGTPESLVSDIYFNAWKSGLKGITVYVEGSRTGVLTSKETKKKQAYTKQIERPKSTDIDIFKTKYKDNTYMILIGKLPDGRPIECFGGLEDGVSLPTKYEKAQLIKKSRGHYSLVIQLSEDPEDVLKVNNISNRFPSGDIITITRMISLALKNNVPVSEIVEQLTRSASSLYDAPAVFARVLKNYIPDEEYINKEKSKGEVCPDCGGELDIRRESGCIAKYCTKCSYFNSKCN